MKLIFGDEVALVGYTQTPQDEENLAEEEQTQDLEDREQEGDERKESTSSPSPGQNKYSQYYEFELPSVQAIPG